MKRSWIALILVICIGLTGAGIAVFHHRAETPVITCGDFSMDNTDLAYYYWSEFFYFSEVFGDYLQERVDFSRPLSEQPYDGQRSWQDYLLEDALATVRDTMVMVFAAREEGFALPEAYDSQYQQQLVDFADAARRAGCRDLEEYLRNSYGKKASVETFSEYLLQTHLAAAYADHLLEQTVISDEAVLEQFERHRDDYTAVYGYDPDTPEQWMEPIREELQTEAYQNAFRQLQSRWQFKINRDAIRLRPPKGLYEGQ